MIIEKNCEVCNKVVITDHIQKKYCNDCRYIVRRQTNNKAIIKWKQLHPEKLIEQTKIYHKKHHAERFKKQLVYKKDKFHNDNYYHFVECLKNKMRFNINKKYYDEKLLGCTVEECKSYLESKFKQGMTWDNYGYRTWHVDHIIPYSAFNFTDEEQVKRCFHYTNLQPLWAEENYKKRDKIEGTGGD